MGVDIMCSTFHVHRPLNGAAVSFVDFLMQICSRLAPLSCQDCVTTSDVMEHGRKKNGAPCPPRGVPPSDVSHVGSPSRWVACVA